MDPLKMYFLLKIGWFSGNQLVKTTLSLPTFFFSKLRSSLHRGAGIDVLIFFFYGWERVFTSIVGREVRLLEGKATKPMMKPTPPPRTQKANFRKPGEKEKKHTSQQNPATFERWKGGELLFLYTSPPPKKNTTPNQTTTTCSLAKSHDGKNSVGIFGRFFEGQCHLWSSCEGSVWSALWGGNWRDPPLFLSCTWFTGLYIGSNRVNQPLIWEMVGQAYNPVDMCS